MRLAITLSAPCSAKSRAGRGTDSSPAAGDDRDPAGQVELLEGHADSVPYTLRADDRPAADRTRPRPAGRTGGEHVRAPRDDARSRSSQAFRDSGLFALQIPALARRFRGRYRDRRSACTRSCAGPTRPPAGRCSRTRRRRRSPPRTPATPPSPRCSPTASPTHAGQFAPRGTAIAVSDDAYQVAGSYSFGSGSAHADWIGGGTLELVDGAPRMITPERPAIRVFFVPRDQVEFAGNWDVMGLVGTGSFDYVVPEQVVDADFTFDLIERPAASGAARCTASACSGSRPSGTPASRSASAAEPSTRSRSSRRGSSASASLRCSPTRSASSTTSARNDAAMRAARASGVRRVRHRPGEARRAATTSTCSSCCRCGRPPRGPPTSPRRRCASPTSRREATGCATRA